MRRKGGVVQVGQGRVVRLVVGGVPRLAELMTGTRARGGMLQRQGAVATGLVGERRGGEMVVMRVVRRHLRLPLRHHVHHVTDGRHADEMLRLARVVVVAQRLFASLRHGDEVKGRSCRRCLRRHAVVVH